MVINRFRAAVVLTAMLAAGCRAGESDTDKRLKETERQLAEAQEKLSETQAQAEHDGQAAAAGVTAEPAQPPAKTGSAVNSAPAETNAQPKKPVEPPKPKDVTLPTGTKIGVRNVTELSTAKQTDGALFDAVLEHDLKAGNVTVAKAGSRVNGIVITADKGGRVKGTASLIVAIRSLVGVKGTTIAVQTDQQSSEAASTKKKDAVRTGVATGVGAVVGGIAGGGKGAAIGAGVGAAAGVGTNMATRGAAAVIPAESLIEFHLTAPVTVTIQP